MTMAEEYSPVESPTRRRGDEVWPPKTSSVRMLPKTGFSPTIMREGSQGKKFVWPPPKTEQDVRSPIPDHMPGHVTHSWLQESNAEGGKPPPFAPRTRPARRCTDNIWPPPSNAMETTSTAQPRPVKRVGRFDDYVKCRASMSVPATYRPPPGTQHMEYTESEVIEYTTTSSMVNSVSTNEVTAVNLVQQKQQQYLQHAQQQQLPLREQQEALERQREEALKRQQQQQQQLQQQRQQQEALQRQQQQQQQQQQQRQQRVVVEEEEEEEEEVEEEEEEVEEEEEEEEEA